MEILNYLRYFFLCCSRGDDVIIWLRLLGMCRNAREKGWKSSSELASFGVSWFFFILLLASFVFCFLFSLAHPDKVTVGVAFQATLLLGFCSLAANPEAGETRSTGEARPTATPFPSGGRFPRATGACTLRHLQLLDGCIVTFLHDEHHRRDSIDDLRLVLDVGVPYTRTFLRVYHLKT